ncbi:hypothetical protein JIX56_11690 [Streptomyces sp. CA-210063]|uniref:hypothetical protein n=1 Tax=Streptomyces sp. CA-210063 TaxID=2801029 RepID=UPI00214CFF40|nr:hypothetical protein [Streptomyces sp. CA-210063]UUU30511.1 hypothetical protein JIX56_11690 [Streptomyces sp. CA-210063]
MSFDEAWGQARSAAAARQISRTQLNQLAASGGSGGPEAQLNVDASLLEDRAKKADTVRTNFKDADNKVMGATEKIDLSGFKSDGAISTFQKRWRSQMHYMDTLLETGVAGNLRISAAEFKAEEAKRLAETKKLQDRKDKS